LNRLASSPELLLTSIELSITSVEQQLSKYRQLLMTKLGTEESIRAFMLSQYDPDPKPPASSDPKVNQSNSAAYVIRANTMLWKQIAALHLRDVDDIEHHISSLHNALPPLPGQNQDRVHVKSPFVQVRPNAEQFFIHPYPDTHDHLLFASKDDNPDSRRYNTHYASDDDQVKARRYTSRGLNPYDPHSEVEERPIPAKV
jgi:hypothetical protein